MSAPAAGRPLPLVFVHGFPLDGRMWEGQEVLRAERPLLAPDLPGFRGTAALPSPGSLAAYAEFVLDRVKAETGGPAVFAGLSMGGYIVFEILRRAADRVGGLILADTRAEADSLEGRAARDAAMELVRAGRREEFLRGFAARLLGATSAARTEPADRLRLMTAEATDEGLLFGLEAIRDRPDYRGDLSGIGVPTLVLVGAEDVVTPPASSEILARAIPGSRREVIPAAGHLAPLEAPEEFNRIVREFLTAGGL